MEDVSSQFGDINRKKSDLRNVDFSEHINCDFWEEKYELWQFWEKNEIKKLHLLFYIRYCSAMNGVKLKSPRIKSKSLPISFKWVEMFLNV